MSNLVTITEVDSSKLNAKILELHDALIGSGSMGDAATIFQDESRLFLEGVIRLTPPTRRKGFGAKQAGEAAIKKDMAKIFTGVHEDMLDDLAIAHGTNNLDVWLTSAGGEKRHIQWQRLDPSGTGMKEFHKKNRNTRGRTFSLKKNGQRGRGDAWFAPYVVTHGDLVDYTANIMARLGRRKAAWGVSLHSVGGKAQAWVSKHLGGARGRVQNELLNPNNPSVRMTNFAPGILDDGRVVSDQVRIRNEAITRKIKGVLSSYSSEWKQGIKISKQARKTSPVTVE